MEPSEYRVRFALTCRQSKTASSSILMMGILTKMFELTGTLAGIQVVLLLKLAPIDSFLLQPHQRTVVPIITAAPRRVVLLGTTEQPFIDAEFEPVAPHSSDSISDDSKEEEDEKTILEMALNDDNTRIPFLDYHSDRAKEDSSSSPDYIDIKIAFMVNVEGVDYGIGVTFDTPAALVVEEQGKPAKVLVSPDETSLDDKDELLEIMAAQLKQRVGDDLALIRTPRCLTISGPVDSYTKHWDDKVKAENAAMPTQELSSKSREQGDADDDGLAFFHDFMRKEMGEATYLRVMQEEPDPEIFTSELLELFDIPEITPESVMNPEEDWNYARDKLGMDGRLGIKLVSFIQKKKTFALARLDQPVSLVAKYRQGQFEMLSPEEEKVVIPQIEQQFRDELQEAGLKLQQ